MRMGAVSGATYYRIQWYGLSGRSSWVEPDGSVYPAAFGRVPASSAPPVIVIDGIAQAHTADLWIRVAACNNKGCGLWSASKQFTAAPGAKRPAPHGDDRPQLQPNVPNPFNSQTVVSYVLPAAGAMRLEVFALNGQRVAVLQHGPQPAGVHRLRWNGRDDAGRPLASGVYLLRLRTDHDVHTRKLLLLR